MARTKVPPSMISGIPGKNLLINPLFLINQRGYISGTATGGANWVTVASLGTSAVSANQDGLNVSLTGFSGLTPGQFAFMNYGGAFIDLDAEL